MKPFDQDAWQPALTFDGTPAFTRHVPAIGVLVLYERQADNHWFVALHRNRRRVGGLALGKHTVQTAQAAALKAVGLKEPAEQRGPLVDDFFAFVPGSCSRCRRDTDVLRFKSQCYECLASPAPVP